MPSLLFNFLLKKIFSSQLNINTSLPDAEVVAQDRQKVAQLETITRRPPKSIRVERLNVNSIPVEKLTPKKDPLKGTLLYFHGGAWYTFSVATHHGWIGTITQLANVTTYIPEYRLAPEHPFPAAIEDAFQVYSWLVNEQHVNPREIIVGGDSAGGQIALALLLMIKESHLPLPGGGILFSPSIDLSGSGDYSKVIDDPILTPELNDINFKRYIGTQDPKQPLISPLFGDLTGFPPLHVQAGSREILLDDSVRLAQKITEIGGSVELKIWEGMTHDFQLFSSLKLFGRLIPECKKANQLAAQFMRKILGR